jgi:hypothetical protein
MGVPASGATSVPLGAVAGSREERAVFRILVLQTLRAAIVPVSGAIFFGLSVLLYANAALAAPVCASDEAVSKELESRYGEVPVARGLASDGKLLQVFASEDGISWTVVLTRPDGVSCIAATGRYWQTVAEKKLGPEA